MNRSPYETLAEQYHTLLEVSESIAAHRLPRDIRSLCIVPLSTARRRLVVLGVDSLEEHHYDGGDLNFLQ
jgi:hypothetical protein